MCLQAGTALYRGMVVEAAVQGISWVNSLKRVKFTSPVFEKRLLSLFSVLGGEMFREISKNEFYNYLCTCIKDEHIISPEEYAEALNGFMDRTHQWSVPRMIAISKTFTSKVRIVFSYNKTEMFMLRAINQYLWKRYGRYISRAYFPSKNKRPGQCLSYIMSREGYGSNYGLHFDVSNYFNSINVEKLYSVLPEELKRDEDFNWVFANTLQNPYVSHKGSIIDAGSKGAMAGLPTSSFFAAIYLAEMDNCFVRQKVPYARYSDDIIIFADKQQKLEEYSERIQEYLSGACLSVNRTKTETILPGQPWTFIGFECSGRKIGLSRHNMEKVKRRVGKWARRLRKRVETRKLEPVKGVASLVRSINRALFKPVNDKYCWAQWVLPTINDTGCLKELDAYIQEKLRFVYTGRYSKKNFRLLPYSKLAELGYNPLGKLYCKFRYDIEKYNEFMEHVELC